MLTTYNRPSFLREAVGSVLAQTVSDFELLVVDDGSTPPAFATKDLRVRVVRLDRNAGLAGARNAGVGAAIGRFVTFLDDDDLYTPDRLALAAEGLARAPVAICWSRFHDRPVGSTRTLEGNVADTILDGPTPSIGATAIRRDVVPRFDERWAAVEDIDWWLRLAPVLEVTTVREVGHLIRRHDSPRHRNDIATRVAENVVLLREREEYFARHRAAAAFRWKRIGLLARRVGDPRLARAAFVQSFRLRPRPRALLHVLRSFGNSHPALPDTTPLGNAQ